MNRTRSDLAKRLGATHYDGRYHFTDKPSLVEGAEKIHELGMGVAKFWLCEDNLPGYRYSSNWDVPFDQRLVDVLKHPYYGSLGWGGAYLDSLLKQAGGKLPAALLEKK